MEREFLSEQSQHAIADLRDIRSIMERSTRFLSLSGWSGVWAGCTALVSAGIAWKLIQPYTIYREERPAAGGAALLYPLVLLALLTFAVAFCGAYYFTWRKAHRARQKMWTHPARQLMLQIVIPVAVGGLFCIAFLLQELYQFIVPACLAFYGLALVNGSKYTLGEVRWLGYSELALACIALFVPYYGLGFMAGGFGLLHILYGVVMWNKYG